MRIEKPDQVSGERNVRVHGGTEVNKIVPVREIEDAAPRSLLPLEQETEGTHTHTHTHNSVLINVQGIMGLLLLQNCQPVEAIFHDEQTFRGNLK